MTVEQQIIKGILAKSSEAVPWLQIGRTYNLLPYTFARDVILTLDPNNEKKTIALIDPKIYKPYLRKLQLDYAVLCLGIPPELPLPPNYKFATEVVAIHDTWRDNNTYLEYEDCDKPISRGKDKKPHAYIPFCQYKFCEFPSRKKFTKAQLKQFHQEGFRTREDVRDLIGFDFEWGKVLRYLLAEKAVRDWGAVPR